VLSAHGTKHFWHRLGWLVDFALVLRSDDVAMLKNCSMTRLERYEAHFSHFRSLSR